jgi:hypothetical protein
VIVEQGKAGIDVPSKEKLVSIIDTFLAAVQAGDLDKILAEREIDDQRRRRQQGCRRQ